MHHGLVDPKPAPWMPASRSAIATAANGYRRQSVEQPAPTAMRPNESCEYVPRFLDLRRADLASARRRLVESALVCQRAIAAAGLIDALREKPGPNPSSAERRCGKTIKGPVRRGTTISLGSSSDAASALSGWILPDVGVRHWMGLSTSSIRGDGKHSVGNCPQGPRFVWG